MRIFYGVVGNYLDITEQVLSTATPEGNIELPATDIERANRYTDPAFGSIKHINVTDNYNNTAYYFATEQAKFNIADNLENKRPNLSREWYEQNHLKGEPTYTQLMKIHSLLSVSFGSMNNELPEQMMVMNFLPRDAKVLELGGNIGRNTLVIATKLIDDRNLVSLECDVNIAQQLTFNRDINSFNFAIESSALSTRKLIQKHWDTIPSEVLLDGYTPVSTINYEQLEQKYNITFDTLVADCEGALYYILQDMPSMLDKITTVIMENDYYVAEHKTKVDEILTEKGFTIVFSEAGGWGPCQGNFFEVWRKL